MSTNRPMQIAGIIIFIAFITAFSYVGCGGGGSGSSTPAEAVNAPNQPTGTALGGTGISYDYTAGGALSNSGHPVEYRFNWADGSYSAWSSSITASKVWLVANTYSVKAQARCVSHTDVVSSLSAGLSVTMSVSTPEATISAPNQPTGPATGNTGVIYNYSTGGASSDSGHALQYRFDWADGTYSTWSASTSASKSWTSDGTYAIKAEARCVLHTSVSSTLSSGLSVVISTPPDAWDSADDVATGGTWLTPTAVSQTHGPHTLSSTDLYDWFRINMTAGYTYYFRTTGSGDNYGQLYSDSTGTDLVAYNDNGSGSSNQFFFFYIAANTQTYYLRIRHSSVGGNWSGTLNYYYTILAKTPVITGSYITAGPAQGVYVEGNYAYIAEGFSGLQIIDISNPAAPTLAGSINTPGTALGVHVVGNYAYVADGDAGLQVINISEPATPTLVGSLDTPGWAVGIYVKNYCAYVAADELGLQIINISEPATPTLLSSINTPGYARAVYVDSFSYYAYVADSGSGLQIIDVSFATTPTLVSSIDTPGTALGVYSPGAVYIYVADGDSGLQVIDALNPNAPFLAASKDTLGTAQSVYVSGNYAYVADGYLGLQVLNIYNPLAPALEGLIDTPGEAFGVYVSNGYVFIADYTSGLQIIKVE
jgi:hypothetical protein